MGPLDNSAENGDDRGVPYPGGKNGAGVYQKIINLMPPHARYFEPFLGGAAVMKLKRPAPLNFGCDLVGSQVSTVSAELAAAGLDCKTFQAFRPGWLGGIGGTGDSRSHNGVSGDGIRYRLFRGCGVRLLELPSLFRATDLVYCDPPYMPETRKGRCLYQYEMTALQHRQFLRAVRKLPCMVMVSGYWSALYAELLDGWSSIQFESMTRGGYTATEWLWFNFPAPVELHDYRYLGTNFRERERIKRKKSRWVVRLRRMPGLERAALISAMVDVFSAGPGTFLGSAPIVKGPEIG